MTRKMEVVSTIIHPVPSTRVSGLRPESSSECCNKHAPVPRSTIFKKEMAKRSGPTDLSSRANSRPLHKRLDQGSGKSHDVMSMHYALDALASWGRHSTGERKSESGRERVPTALSKKLARTALLAPREQVLHTRCNICCLVLYRLVPNMGAGSSFGPRCAATKVSSMRPQCNQASSRARHLPSCKILV